MNIDIHGKFNELLALTAQLTSINSERKRLLESKRDVEKIIADYIVLSGKEALKHKGKIFSLEKKVSAYQLPKNQRLHVANTYLNTMGLTPDQIDYFYEMQKRQEPQIKSSIKITNADE